MMPGQMSRSRSIALLLVLFGGTLLGCGRNQTTIPPGGQEVHVVVTGSEIRLEPDTVPAGDVYVVLDTPGSSVILVERQRAAEETPGPLGDDDLARIALGDMQGTAIQGFDDTGCSTEQRAEDRGQMGYCGNVTKVVLSAGKVAFLSNDPAGAPEGLVPPQSMAVLEVRP